MLRITFVHGGGENAYDIDGSIVRSLTGLLADRAAIAYPRITGLERIDWEQTEMQLREVLDDAAAGTILVAHSIGACASLKLLAMHERHTIAGAVLLAPPYKGADSHWGVDDFTLPDDLAARLERLPLSIYHCEDDDVIPARDALQYRDKMPQARIVIFPSGGHQFEGRLDTIAGALRQGLS